MGGLRLRLHERLRPKPCQTMEITPTPGVEPELEPLAAFKGEVESRFGGFTWLQLEIHQRSYFAKRFLKRLNSTREATPPEEPEPEPFLEEPEPCQTGPTSPRPRTQPSTSPPDPPISPIRFPPRALQGASEFGTVASPWAGGDAASGERFQGAEACGGVVAKSRREVLRPRRTTARVASRRWRMELGYPSCNCSN
jgi:hypothetical protein